MWRLNLKDFGKRDEGTEEKRDVEMPPAFTRVVPFDKTKTKPNILQRSLSKLSHKGSSRAFSQRQPSSDRRLPTQKRKNSSQSHSHSHSLIMTQSRIPHFPKQPCVSVESRLLDRKEEPNEHQCSNLELSGQILRSVGVVGGKVSCGTQTDASDESSEPSILMSSANHTSESMQLIAEAMIGKERSTQGFRKEIQSMQAQLSRLQKATETYHLDVAKIQIAFNSMRLFVARELCQFRQLVVSVISQVTISLNKQQDTNIHDDPAHLQKPKSSRPLIVRKRHSSELHKPITRKPSPESCVTDIISKISLMKEKLQHSTSKEPLAGFKFDPFGTPPPTNHPNKRDRDPRRYYLPVSKIEHTI